MPSAPPSHRPRSARLDRAAARQADRQRGSAAKRGYDRRWRKAAKAYLAEHPLCEPEDCDRPKPHPSTVVDHKVPHRGDRELFWDRTNWQACCKPYHDRKTATEDGGFGRRRH